MEFYQVVAICIVICMAFVIDSTVKLFRYRRRNKIEQSFLKFRDLQILRRPNDFEMQEARLTYKNWISSGAMLVLIITFLVISPPSLRDAKPPPLWPLSSGEETAPATPDAASDAVPPRDG